MSDNPLARFKRSYKKGDHLGDEGDVADAFFVLIEGDVGIYVAEKQVAVINEPGSYFGEMAALLEQKRTATMICQTDVAVYAMPIHGLENLIKSNPQMAIKLARMLAKRLDAYIHGRNGTNEPAKSGDAQPQAGLPGRAA
jgi:CRP-like cAMP-binding protein